MTATRSELEQMLGRSRRLALKMGRRAHARLGEARLAGVRGGDRVALRLITTAILFSTRARAISAMLREGAP